MTQQQNAPARLAGRRVSSASANGPVRPVLIADEKTLADLSVFLRYFFVGLADESGMAALVCPPDYDINSVLTPSIEVIRHPAYDAPLLWRQNHRKLVDALVKFRPSILHCLGAGRANLTKTLAEQLDLPYVLTLNSLQSRFRKCPISARQCAAIIAPTETLASHLAKIYTRFGDRIRQINVGTLVEPRCACFSVPSRITGIVVVNRLDKAADFESLFGAIKHLAIDGHELMLLLIGTGPAEQEVRELRRALGLSQIVYIIPDIQPLRSVLADADIFIQPQPARAFNSSLMEAMSTGLAVAGCAGGVDDLLIENQTAALFEPADELSIFACLQRLLEKHEFARQLASEAQSHLRKKYTVSGMVSSILQTYRGAQQWHKTKAALFTSARSGA
jgi:glycosyltransferase involved in cell wall biosynthesis